MTRKRDRLPEDHEDYQSRTEVKNNMLALQAFGEQLLALPKPVYDTFPIPAELDSALKEMARIKSNNAKKRQLQYIGKILRNMDVEPLKKAYDDLAEGRKRLSRSLIKLEALRDELIEGKERVFETVIADHPECDIQQFRQLIRLCQKEKETVNNKKNYKKLFQFLKELKGF